VADMKERMSLTAPEECPYGHQCFGDGQGHVCAAERRIPGDGVFIRTPQQVDCPFAAQCDGGYSCSCPTRIELYERFNL
jgi:hypothetical protein